MSFIFFEKDGFFFGILVLNVKGIEVFVVVIEEEDDDEEIVFFVIVLWLDYMKLIYIWFVIDFVFVLVGDLYVDGVVKFLDK